MKKKSKDNIQSILYAILAALFIRSFLYEPFSIPSGSMYPTLKIGDYLFVSKSSYGFSKHSLPFSIPLIPSRIFFSQPERGDVVVFKTPQDNKTDYIKRLIGLPGDIIKIDSNQIFINGEIIGREFVANEKYKDSQHNSYFLKKFKETLPNGKSYNVYENKKKIIQTDYYKETVVPGDSYFVLGDNRDNSLDSRFIGFVPKKNLVGRAELVFISFNVDIGSFLKFWTWYPALRKNRFFVSLLPDSG